MKFAQRSVLYSLLNAFKTVIFRIVCALVHVLEKSLFVLRNVLVAPNVLMDVTINVKIVFANARILRSIKIGVRVSIKTV